MNISYQLDPASTSKVLRAFLLMGGMLQSYMVKNASTDGLRFSFGIFIIKESFRE